MDTVLAIPAAHVSAKDLDLFLFGRLDKEDFSRIDAHVDACRPCRAQLESVAKSRRKSGYGSLPAPEERRQDHRIPTDDPAVLRVLDPGPRPYPSIVQRMDVRVVDVSRNGVKLYTPSEIPTAALVQVRVRDSVIVGEVRYCVVADAGFHAGIQIHGIEDLGRPEVRVGCLATEILTAYIRAELAGDALAVANSHLTGCSFCQDNLTHEIRRMWRSGGQSDARVPVRANDSGLVRTLHPFSPQLWEVGLLAVSTDGIRLRAPLTLQPGATIQLFVGNTLMLAQVRSSSDQGSHAASLGIWVMLTLPS